MKKSISSLGNNKGRRAICVVLGFDHPSIDPEEITHRLGKQPSMAAMAGSHYVSVDGDELPARHGTSKWQLAQYFLPSARESDDISSVIGDTLTMLEQHATFVTRIAHDGRVSIWVAFNGADHHGIVLACGLLRRMAKLHVNFGIEVFPHGVG